MKMDAVQVMFPNNMKTIKIKPVTNVISPSRVIPCVSVFITPATVAEMPNIPAIFQMLEPITVPTPISTLPDNDAITADPNSGREVPIADAVTPSIIWDIPRAEPISTKLSTNMSADFITMISETANAPTRATS